MSKNKQLIVQYGGRRSGETKKLIEELRPDLDVYVYNGFTDEEKGIIMEALSTYITYLDRQKHHLVLSENVVNKRLKEVDAIKIKVGSVRR